jgi:hypothetical protein
VTPKPKTYLASLLCDDDTLQHQDPAKPIDVATTGLAGGAPPLVTLTAADSDEQLELSRQRAIRAEADLAVRQTDAYWDLYVATEQIARATAGEDELRARLAVLEQEIEDARGVALAVQRSSSWRLTAPLRRGKRLMRRG